MQEDLTMLSWSMNCEEKMPANLKDTPSKRPSSTDDHLQAEVQKGLSIWCRKPWNCPEISLHHVDQNGIQVLFELDPHFG